MLVLKYLNDFKPDWISLQFVCYAFHPKGITHGLARKIAPLLTGRKLHIMFHEIWLCKEQGWSWPQRAVGLLQRYFIRRLVRATRPAVLHTSNACYVEILNKNKIPAAELGLFGNVPIISEPGSVWIQSQLRTALGGEYRRETLWLFGLFGALHAQWPPEPLFTRLHRVAQAAGKTPVILSIGRTGQAGLELWNRMAQDYSDRFVFLRLGEQSLERISEYLSFLDCGIATSPRSIIGKSGTSISMLEHGLPVIVNRNDIDICSPRRAKGENNPFFIPCDTSLEIRLRHGLEKPPRGSRRPRVVQSFLSDLECAGHIGSSGQFLSESRMCEHGVPSGVRTIH